MRRKKKADGRNGVQFLGILSSYSVVGGCLARGMLVDLLDPHGRTRWGSHRASINANSP